MQGLTKVFSRVPKSTYFLMLLLLNLTLLTCAYIFYTGSFSFWLYPLSYLGHTFSYAEGLPNTTSSLLYGVSMLLSGVVMLLLSTRYRVLVAVQRDWLKYALCLAAAFGFFVASFSPDDTAHAAHVFGSASFAFSLWFLTTIEIYDLKARLGKFRHVALQLSLQIPAIVYAVTYFADLSPLNYVVQKFAFLCLVVALAYVCVADRTSDTSIPSEQLK